MLSPVLLRHAMKQAFCRNVSVELLIVRPKMESGTLVHRGYTYTSRVCSLAKVDQQGGNGSTETLRASRS